jgi:SpoVK/Ycf46/Vps4 family AAA+-type ATPase
MFLSALGGNQSVDNILVFGSTNFRNLIDDAILRRFTPDFYVRLPSKADRKSIIEKCLPAL